MPVSRTTKKASESLRHYRNKRNFLRTAEPWGVSPSPSSSSLRYVVQKHAARGLHYDFRLELDGTLKSWAVPKGPSLNPTDKRLAVHVEDHPMEYADFEGTIPPRQYGAGTVMVWDQGRWIPDGNPKRAYEKGHLKFTLAGQKLKGRWSLVRIGGARNRDKNKWLLIKGRDEAARTAATDSAVRLATSVKSGLSMEEIAQARHDTWHTDRQPSGGAPSNPANNRNHHLRQASFVGLRDDKPAHLIVRESTAHVPMSQLGVASRDEENSPRSSARARGVGVRKQTLKPTGVPTVAGIRISNPSRLLFPHDGITKLELAQFYERIAGWILPHLRKRPLTLLRCPDGQGTGCFYQKHVTGQIHEAIDRVEVEERNGPACYMVVNTPAALIALVQLGVLEFHTWGATQERLDRPDRMILDLDPAPDVPWREVSEAAGLVRTVLDELGLRSFLKTTGGKGLHVVVPLERRHSWGEVKRFARCLAGHLARTLPERFTDNMAKRARKGKVYVDYLRNGQGATTVAAYSTRARMGAPVSVPLMWDECSPALRSDHFTVHTIEARLSQLTQDPWAEYATVQQHLTAEMRQRVGMVRREL
ncbi:MAG: DNA ligase D [Nitrospira sp.]|nr:DNA ligase D [Nitrospira sp.]